jgi:hypothetical protein
VVAKEKPGAPPQLQYLNIVWNLSEFFGVNETVDLRCVRVLKCLDDLICNVHSADPGRQRAMRGQVVKRESDLLGKRSLIGGDKTHN